MEAILLDCIGRRRSPATVAGYHAGRPPGNEGLRYPADPPPVEEIVRLMRAAGDGTNGARLGGLIVVLWRAGLRISETLALAESDLDRNRGPILVTREKGGKRREVGIDAWGLQQLDPWLRTREQMPVGALSASSMDRVAVDLGRRPRFACSCGKRQPAPVCDVASHRTSFAMPTPSKWPARAFRSS
jgi:integrase